MGFSRAEVDVVVRKLTEKGQSVELNVIIDRLMKGEGKQKGWFGR
jgi:hypothetical protein